MVGQDHPRACGENLSPPVSVRDVVGSPPRMRGKQQVVKAANDNARITPAHAGKTYRVNTQRFWIEDHPRACGENPAFWLSIMSRVGSPPRMRGKLRKRTLIMKSCGITPAHAGKTRKNGQTYYNVEDHPRACGENSTI